jgi:hypothetical protein
MYSVSKHIVTWGINSGNSLSAEFERIIAFDE